MLGSDFKKVLKQSDLDVTPRRIHMLQLFESSYKLDKKPLDAKYFINVLHADRVTVFRMLNTFVDKGIIRKLEFGEGKARYELATKGDHHHLICTSCGSVKDIEDKYMNKLEKEIQRDKKFIVKSHSLEFFGLCKNCQN